MPERIQKPADPVPWIQTSYPGSPEYMHCVENIAFGPDGYLYVGNGARTDGGTPEILDDGEELALVLRRRRGRDGRGDIAPHEERARK